ncbi:MAG TPA: TolC family protein [Candidatus Cybelea sp.]|jgi:outer membrane protein TolC|nr:TolC family protein [Candidatus Cybelea sp.]
MFVLIAAQVTLAQAIAVAAARSPALRIATDVYRLTGANVKIVATPYQPNVAGTLSAVAGSSDRTAVSPEEDVAGVGVTQLVFDGGHVLAQIRAAQAEQRAGSGTLARSAQQIAFGVAQTYYSALEAEAAVRLALRIVDQDRAQENLIRAQIDAGIASRVDLATAQIPTAQALVQVARARGQNVASLAAFHNAMGLHADADVEPADDPTSQTSASLISNEPSSYDVAVAHAMTERPDYRSAQQSLTAAQQTLRAAQRLASPQVSLIANTGVAAFPGSGLGTLANNYVGATVALPLYDQGIRNAQSDSAAIAVDQQDASVSQTELGIESDVRQALGTLDGARDALAQAESELRTAQEVLVDTQVQYRAGITNLALLLNAQSGLTQAQTDRLDAVFALRQAEESYLFALGDLRI